MVSFTPFHRGRHVWGLLLTSATFFIKEPNKQISLARENPQILDLQFDSDC